jgi:hypothetical protein
MGGNGSFNPMTQISPFRILVIAALFGGAGCERQTVNPPTEPADPIATPGVEAPAASAPPGMGGLMQGAGPATFVGRWAARADWCANASGERRPITLSPLRFEGYENSCAITSLDQVADGYEATLACQADGGASRERVRLSVRGEVLRLTWLDRNDAVVLLVRCPASPEVGAVPPS